MTSDDSQLQAPPQRQGDVGERIAILLDALLVEHRELASLMRSSPAKAPWNGHYVAHMKLLLARQDVGFQSIMDEKPDMSAILREMLRRHPLHTDCFMQAPLIAAANGHDGGVLGPGSVRLMLGKHLDSAPAYGMALHDLLLGGPLCAALRRFRDGTARAIQALPAGARALFVGDVAAAIAGTLPDAACRHVRIERVEADLADLTIAMLAETAAVPSNLADRAPGFDAIFVTAFAASAAGDAPSSRGVDDELTARLFSQLRPGGALIIACVLADGFAQLRRQPHWPMMAGHAEPWGKTPAQIRRLAQGLPADPRVAELLAEDLATPLQDDALLATLRLST